MHQNLAEGRDVAVRGNLAGAATLQTLEAERQLNGVEAQSNDSLELS